MVDKQLYLRKFALTNSKNKRTEKINLEDCTVKLNDALRSSRKIARARAEKV